MIPEQFAYVVTWFMWMLAPFIGSFLQFQAGASFISTLPVFMAGFCPFLILIAALLKKNTYWKITFFDIVCGMFSFLAMVLWVLTRNTALSVVFVILADVLAAVPTIIKCWKFPDTETGLTYLPGVINSIIGLLIIKNWIFSIYSLNIYFIIVNLAILILIFRKKIFT